MKRFLNNHWRLLLSPLLVIGIFQVLTMISSYENALNEEDIVQLLRGLSDHETSRYFGEVILSLSETDFEAVENESAQMQRIIDTLQFMADTTRAKANRGLSHFGGSLNRYKKRYTRASDAHFADNDYYRALERFLRSRDQGIDDILDDSTLLSTITAEEVLNSGSRSRSHRKSVTYAARGEISLTTPFQDVTAANIFLDRREHSVEITNVFSGDLDAKINHWYIEPLRVKGFELIAYQGYMEAGYRAGLKELALDKLRVNAARASLIEMTHKRIQEDLSTLLYALTGERWQVRIIADRRAESGE